MLRVQFLRCTRVESFTEYLARVLFAIAPILGSYEDDVPEDIKLQRLKELIDAFRAGAQARNTEMRLGTEQLVLVEGPSRRSTEEEPRLTGRTGWFCAVCRWELSHAKACGEKRLAIIVVTCLQPHALFVFRWQSTCRLQ